MQCALQWIGSILASQEQVALRGYMHFGHLTFHRDVPMGAHCGIHIAVECQMVELKGIQHRSNINIQVLCAKCHYTHIYNIKKLTKM